jgi:hypothetical protein
MSDKSRYDLANIRDDFSDAPILELLDILRDETLFFHSPKNDRNYVFHIQRFPVEDKPSSPAIIIKIREESGPENNSMLNINSVHTLYDSCMYLIDTYKR